VVRGRDVLLASNMKELMSVLNCPGQGVLHLVLDLPTVVQEISAEIRRLRGTA
jgi:hypothetical protein